MKIKLILKTKGTKRNRIYAIEKKLISTRRNAPFYSATSLNTRGKGRITSFAKDKMFHKDLYADLVAPSLRVPLLGGEVFFINMSLSF